MRVPGPADALGLVGRAWQAVEQAVELVPRVTTLLTGAEGLLRRTTGLVTAAEATETAAAEALSRAGELEEAAAVLALNAETLVQQAATLSADAATVVTRSAALLSDVEPLLAKLQPILQRLADTTSEHEVDSVVRLVDALPSIVDKLDADILPVLDTLSTVAPDIRDLLDVSRELNELISAVPGLGRAKRRIEEEHSEAAAQAAYRADEEVSTSPDRRRTT